MNRFVRYFLYFFATWVTCVLLLVISLTTPALNHWLINKAVDTVPELTISQVQGTLPGNLVIKGISYQSQGSHLHIETVSTHWQWVALFRGAIKFQGIAVQGVDYEYADSGATDDAQDSVDFSLPVLLQVDRLTLVDVKIHYAEKDYQLDQLTTALHLSGSEFSILNLQAHFADALLNIDGSVLIQESFPFQFRLNGLGTIPELGDVQGHIKLHGNSEKIVFTKQLLLPFPIMASGSIALQGKQPFIDVQGNWQNLRWPLHSEPEYVSEQGDFVLQGPIESYQLKVNGKIHGTRIPDSSIQLHGTGSLDKLIVDTMSIDTMQGKILTTGFISWADHVLWEMQIEAQQLSLATIQSDYHGVINIETQFAGNTRSGLHISAAISKLDGLLENLPVRGQGNLDYDGSSLTVNDLVLGAGNNQLRVQGRLDDNSALDFSLQASELSLFRPDLSGSVVATGKLTGRLQNPVVELDMQTDGVQFDQLKLGSSNLSARIDPTNSGHFSLTAKVQQLIVNDTPINSIALKAGGNYRAHTIDAFVATPQGQMNVAVKGDFQQQRSRWQGQIKSWELNTTQLGSWKMAQATTLDVSFIDRHVKINSSDLCLQKTSDPAMLCVKADASRGQVQGIKAQVSDFPVAALSPWLPENMQIQSHLSARLELHFHEFMSGKLALSLTPGEIKFSSDEQPYQVPFADLKLNADLQQDDLNVQFGMLFNEQDRINGSLSLQPFSKLEQSQLEGQLAAHVADMGFLNALDLPAKQITGSLHSEIVLQGSAASPEFIRLDAGLDNVGFTVPETGMEVANLSLAAKQKSNVSIDLQGSADVNGTQAVLQGNIKLGQLGGPELYLTLQGEQLKIVQLPEAEIWSSVDMKLFYNREGIDIQGKLQVPKASIIFVELPENAVSVSQDEVIIGSDTAAPKQKSVPVQAKIAIELGDDVTLQGFGLNTKLQGELEADYGNNRFRLFNQLNLIEGTYKAYGQDLSIEKGQLLFKGSVDNPGINILASRPATSWDDNVVAYFAMTGTLNDAKTRVYTKPALPESEALAYLLTGGPLDKTNTSSASLLGKAAMSYGKDYIDSVMGSVGIDEVDLKGTGLADNSLVLGKRITPRLYVRYIMDVITARMIFTAEYKLTEHISIEGKSGDTHGGDIKYSIEFD